MNINIVLDVEWQYPSTKLHGIKPLMTVIITNTAARTSYVTSPDTVNSGIRFVDTSQKIKHSPIHQFMCRMQSLNITNLSPQFPSGSSKHRNYVLISAAVPISVPVPKPYLATSCYAHLPASFNGNSAVRKFSEKLDAISKF